MKTRFRTRKGTCRRCLRSLSVLDRLTESGYTVRLEGEKLKVRGPNRPGVEALIDELRRDRDAVVALLKDAESGPPSLAEVEAALPPIVRLVSYEPKRPPFAVAPVSVVTNTGRFYRAYLRNLKARIEKPEGYHCAPVADILAKLADAGLELRIEP